MQITGSSKLIMLSTELLKIEHRGNVIQFRVCEFFFFFFFFWGGGGGGYFFHLFVFTGSYLCWPEREREREIDR